MSVLWPLLLLLDGLFLLLMVKRTLANNQQTDTKICGVFLALVIFVFLLDLNSEISFAEVDQEIIEPTVKRFDPFSYAASNTVPFYANEKWRSDLLCASFSCLLLAVLGLVVKQFRTAKILISTVFFAVLICFREFNLSKQTISKSVENGIPVHLLPDEGRIRAVDIQNVYTNDSVVDVAPGLLASVKKWRGTMKTTGALLSENPTDAAAEKNAAANELFSLPELPDGVVSDLARMFQSEDEDEVWRDYCLQFLGSALEREDGVTDADRALAREMLVGALASTNATFAGTALRALHRGDPADPLVASNALRIARDPSYSAPSRTTALLILEECVPATSSTLAETAASVSADPTASPVLRQAADAIRRRHAVSAPEN